MVVYIFAGSISLHKASAPYSTQGIHWLTFNLQPVLGIVAGTVVGVIGVGYAALQFVPSIEPPQNVRDANGEWGAEQI